VCAAHPSAGGNGRICLIDEAGFQFDIRHSEFEISFMPLYEYELCEGDCKVCGGKFTLRRPLSAKPLTHCPACKKPVRKIISTFNSPHKLKPLSITDAKKAGFTVLKKISKGEYERQ
jgi:putative FmdB family regulatory protein